MLQILARHWQPSAKIYINDCSLKLPHSFLEVESFVERAGCCFTTYFEV
jgi:hypothetical protein